MGGRWGKRLQGHTRVTNAGDHFSGPFGDFQSQYNPPTFSRWWFSQALRDAGSEARVIAWNWAWEFYEKDPQVEIVQGLPKDVSVLADFERGATRVLAGKRRRIEEYSLSYPGPSPRFVGSLRAARRRGVDVMAKLQFGTTHELATVPNLALIGSLYDKARAMRRLRVKSFLGCWNFGAMLTANTAAMMRFLDAKRLAPRRQAMAAFARSYSPGAGPEVVEAWELFGRAMRSYPFANDFLYYSPMNYAVVQPIRFGPTDPEPVGPSWRFVARGEDLAQSLETFTLDEVIECLGELSRRWAQGVRRLAVGLGPCAAPTAVEEMNSARMAGHCFRSCWNVYRAYRLRLPWRERNRAALRPVLRDELDHLPEARAIARADRRMGFHSEPQRYFFTASAIGAKIRQLQETLAAGR